MEKTNRIDTLVDPSFDLSLFLSFLDILHLQLHTVYQKGGNITVTVGNIVARVSSYIRHFPHVSCSHVCILHFDLWFVLRRLPNDSA
jgi:hypothetical protein